LAHAAGQAEGEVTPIWGLAEFDDGKPADKAKHATCFPCHEIVKARDLVFNRYAP
jgi:hypothetical protein